MKRWQSLPIDCPEEEAVQATEEQLHKFVEDIQMLVDSERGIPEIREFEPDLSSLIISDRFPTTLFPRGVNASIVPKRVFVAKSRTGKYVFHDPDLDDPQGKVLHRGSTFYYHDKRLRVLEIETRWVDSIPTYYVCEAVEI